MSLASLIAKGTFTLKRPVWSSDGAGTPTRASETVIATGVPGRIEDEEVRTESIEIADSKQMSISHKIFVFSTAIQNGDLIYSSDGLVFRVERLLKHRGMGNIQGYSTVYANEVKE